MAVDFLWLGFILNFCLLFFPIYLSLTVRQYFRKPIFVVNLAEYSPSPVEAAL